MSKKKQTSPRTLLIDIETSPLEVFTWGLFDQNIALNQIIKDWSILSFAAKWVGSDKMIYMDTRNKKDPRDDKDLVKVVCKLLDESDIVISHYGKKFDIPKIDTRRLKHNLPMFSMPKHEDTKQMSGKYAFSSNKLEYIAKYLDTKHKKLVGERKFQGMELWKACLNKNLEGWKEMEKYNKYDVLTLQDVYEKLSPRCSTLNPSLWNDEPGHVCTCGSTKLEKKGFAYTSASKYQRYRCLGCGKNYSRKQNLFSKEKKRSLLSGVK